MFFEKWTENLILLFFNLAFLNMINGVVYLFGKHSLSLKATSMISILFRRNSLCIKSMPGKKSRKMTS